MSRSILLFALALLLLTCRSSDTDYVDDLEVDPPADFTSWAATPPMGWNSWDCYGPTVREDEVRANADYMAEHLRAYGWEYVVVDIRWFVENTKSHGYNQDDPIYVMDEYGRYLPATNRFPSAADGAGFRPLAEYIHGLGLKFGIHLMRGVPVEAVKRQLPIKGAGGVTANQIYTEEEQCKWLRDNYTVVAGRPGAQEYYNSIFELYAEWGVDFVKIDDLSAPIYHEEEIDMIRRAIDRTGREIVLSTSPGPTPVEDAGHVSTHANMWRMVNDVWDSWSHLDHLFDVSEAWYPYIGNGTWPDCDMMPLGRLSIRGEVGDDRTTNLTTDEQYTLMNLFTIFRSPLMFGGDLPSNDNFTNALLTNEDVLRMHRESEGTRLLFSDEQKVAITAEHPAEGWHYLALFNRADEGKRTVSVELADLEIEGAATVTDLWTGDTLGSFTGTFGQELDPHASGLYRIE